MSYIITLECHLLDMEVDMPNVKTMTPEEAYQKLAEIQERSRDRQKDHYQQSKRRGKVKVSVFLSTEASRILERERDAGRTISDILSDALVTWDRQIKPTRIPQKPIVPSPLSEAGSKPPSPLPDGSRPFDEVKTVARIVELGKQGLSDPKIAEQLEVEGWLTATGNREWHRVVVGRIRRKAMK